MPDELKAEIQKLRKQLLAERVSTAARAAGAWPTALDHLCRLAAVRYEAELKLGDLPSTMEVGSWMRAQRVDPTTNYLFQGDAEPETEKGFKEPNPWLKAHWNLTRQGRIYKKDRALARRLATAAGRRVTW